MKTGLELLCRTSKSHRFSGQPPQVFELRQPIPVVDMCAMAGRPSAVSFTRLFSIHAGFERFAVIVAGSIVRGNSEPASDFEIIAFHEQSWQRRVQNGVTARPMSEPT